MFNKIVLPSTFNNSDVTKNETTNLDNTLKTIFTNPTSEKLLITIREISKDYNLNVQDINFCYEFHFYNQREPTAKGIIVALVNLGLVKLANTDRDLNYFYSLAKKYGGPTGLSVQEMYSGLIRDRCYSEKIVNRYLNSIIKRP